MQHTITEIGFCVHFDNEKWEVKQSKNWFMKHKHVDLTDLTNKNRNLHINTAGIYRQESWYLTVRKCGCKPTRKTW